MIRSLFLALGLYSVLVGVECLAVERAYLATGEGTMAQAFSQHVAQGSREVVPPDWAPWSLMSGGAVVMLYTITLPAKLRG